MIEEQWHHAFMGDDNDQQPDDALDTKPAVPTDGVPELSADSLVVANGAVPAVLANPVALIQGLRFLQQRIPGFTQLSVEEERAMIRVASLDPEFLEAGLRAACAWDGTKSFVGRSGEELRGEDGEIRHWDETQSAFLTTVKGISAANRKRRYRLGKAILDLYFMLGTMIDMESHRYLRPYYEEMKRAYLNRKRKRRKAEKPDKPEERSPPAPSPTARISRSQSSRETESRARHAPKLLTRFSIWIGA